MRYKIIPYIFILSLASMNKGRNFILRDRRRERERERERDGGGEGGGEEVYSLTTGFSNRVNKSQGREGGEGEGGEREGGR